MITACAPIAFPSRRCAKKRGAHAVRLKDGQMGYRVRKWGNGQMGDHNARWRKGRGLARGMRALKTISAKLGGAH